jgi:hypothetical protein
LTGQLSQLQNECTLLQERLRVATQESEGLKQAQSQAQEITATLTLRAMTAETALESMKAHNEQSEPKVNEAKKP